MKRQHLTYYSLQWSSCFWEESTSSTGKGIDPPTPWVFPACAAIPVQSLWTLLSLLQRAKVLLSKPALDRASHLVTGLFDVDSPLQCISFVFEGSASTIQQGLKFHILQVLQCDNLWAGYALYIFHKRTPSPESGMWKSQCFKVYIDRNSFGDSWVWDENTLVILTIWESTLYLPLKGANIQINGAEKHSMVSVMLV